MGVRDDSLFAETDKIGKQTRVEAQQRGDDALALVVKLLEVLELLLAARKHDA